MQQMVNQGIFRIVAFSALALGVLASGCADVSARRSASGWSKSLMQPSGFVTLGKAAGSSLAESSDKSRAKVLGKVSKQVADVVNGIVVLDPKKRLVNRSQKRNSSRRGVQKFSLPLRGMTEIDVDRRRLADDGSTRVDLRYRSTQSPAGLSGFYRGYLERQGFAMREINVAVDERSPIQLLGQRGNDQVRAVFTRDRGLAMSVANLSVKLEKKVKRRRR